MGVVVTGMHRSGTSAVARVVEGLGLSPGDGDPMAPAAANPRGFFERHDVMQLNDRWLGRLGGAWWAPPRVSSRAWRSLDEDALRREREALDLLSPDVTNWYVKDPRIALLLPLWDRLALHELPVVLVVREPREVATSIRMRDRMRDRRALALWAEYNRAVQRTSAGRRLLVVDYDRLVREPVSAVEAIADFLHGTGHMVADHDQDEVIGLVERHLRRQRTTRLAGLSEQLARDLDDTYEALSKRHAHQGEDGLDDLPTPEWVDEILDELDDLLDAETQVLAARDESTRVARELDRASSLAARLEATAAATAADRARLLEQANELSVALAQRDRVMAVLRQDKQRLTTQLETTVGAYEVDQAELLDELQALDAIVHDSVASLDAMRAELVHWQDVAQAAGRDLEEARRESTALHDRWHEASVAADAWRDERRAALEALDALTLEVARLRASRHNAQVEAGAWQQRAEAVAGDLDESRRESRELNERLRKASSSAASERAVRQAALDALEADLRRERAVLLTSRFERDNAVGALEAALAELDRLTTELVDVRASRSFIYGRRLTAPARWLRGDRRPGQEPTP